jgi:hypothetical protein
VARTPEPADPRALRFEQAVVAVVLLSGFVFRIVWVVPGVGVLLLVAVVTGERANAFARVYDALFGDRLDPRAGTESPDGTRVTRSVEVALLAVGSLWVFLGVSGLAWVFALPVAAITAIAATTGINLVSLLRDRRAR